MRALDRKLLRDLWHLRGQALAIAAVIMGGVATLVMSLSTYDALVTTRDRFYAEGRFADVFANLKRAPEPVADRLRELPGVERLETRVVAGVKLEVAGFSDPITGLVVSVPDEGEPLLDAPYLKRGRMVRPGDADEVVVSDSFADAHRLEPGDRLAAITPEHDLLIGNAATDAFCQRRRHGDHADFRLECAQPVNQQVDIVAGGDA